MKASELGISLGLMKPGPCNAITDVSGVRVGHYTLMKGPEKPGGSAFRTGITAILPHGGNVFVKPVSAACYVINGFGKTVGLPQITEIGLIQTPILLTSTLNVWRVADGLVDYVLRDNPEAASINPVVGECNDSWLSDSQKRPLGKEEVFAAIENAKEGPVAEGSVGAGTGMNSYGWKAGVGTASRLLPETVGPYKLGTLVVANHGQSELFNIQGLPVGRILAPYREGIGNTSGQYRPSGSCMIIIATDAPCSTLMLQRICHRVSHGLARGGTYTSCGSGDFAIAFTTCRPTETQKPKEFLRRVFDDMDRSACAALFQSTVETVEEAVVNAIISAETMVGNQGRVRQGIPREELKKIMKQYPREESIKNVGR